MWLFAGAPGPDVLIIDDDAAMRNMVIDVLGLSGLKVAGAANGRDGLVSARGAVPALIFLDMDMPVMSGLEVLVALRAEKTLQAVPVVMLTSRQTVADVESAYARGATDYLAKPFVISHLVEKAGKHLPPDRRPRPYS